MSFIPKHLIQLCCGSLFLLFYACDDFNTPEKKNNKVSKKVYNGIKKNYLKGKLASTISYKDSLKNGPAVNYYANGSVNMEFHYKNNKKEGNYKWYFENGALYLEGNYSSGKKEGIFSLYRDNGTLKSEMPWSKDLPCVGLKEYTPSGKLKSSPTVKVTEVNTAKLNGKCVYHLKLSNNSKNVKFYESKLNENKSFDPFFPQIDGKKGKAALTVYVPKGSYMMKTISIVAYQQATDKNYYVIQKNVNVALENRY
jgi:hypothetical protein